MFNIPKTVLCTTINNGNSFVRQFVVARVIWNEKYSLSTRRIVVYNNTTDCIVVSTWDSYHNFVQLSAFHFISFRIEFHSIFQFNFVLRTKVYKMFEWFEVRHKLGSRKCFDYDRWFWKLCSTLFNLFYIQQKRQNTKQSQKFSFTTWISWYTSYSERNEAILTEWIY